MPESGWTQLELRALVGGQKQWGEGHGFGVSEQMSLANSSYQNVSFMRAGPESGLFPMDPQCWRPSTNRG